METINVNGKMYRSVEQGKRIVLVVDRGWVFAGDVEERDGRIYLYRAVWPMRWEGIGFDGLLENPKSPKVCMKSLGSRVVDVPAECELFRVAVDDDWGL